MNDKQQSIHDIYLDWRKAINVLAQSENIDNAECVELRNQALDLGCRYHRMTGSHVALHTITKK